MNLRRRRRALASLFLGAWLFALFVGVANACLPGGAADMSPTAAMAMGAGHGDGEDQAPGCLQFCYDDAPLFSKLQLVQDQPAGQPLLVASGSAMRSRVSASAPSMAYLAHPRQDVPLLLRTLRLAL